MTYKSRHKNTRTYIWEPVHNRMKKIAIQYGISCNKTMVNAVDKFIASAFNRSNVPIEQYQKDSFLVDAVFIDAIKYLKSIMSDNMLLMLEDFPGTGGTEMMTVVLPHSKFHFLRKFCDSNNIPLYKLLSMLAFEEVRKYHIDEALIAELSKKKESLLDELRKVQKK